LDEDIVWQRNKCGFGLPQDQIWGMATDLDASDFGPTGCLTRQMDGDEMA